MQFKYHPEIEGLKVNEDGTSLKLNGKHQTIHERPNGYKFIIFKGKTIGIVRLICECWHGMAPSHKHVASRLNLYKNNLHYKNISWKMQGQNLKKFNKLTPLDIKNIKKRLKQGDKQVQIAKDYEVSKSSISLIKNS